MNLQCWSSKLIPGSLSYLSYKERQDTTNLKIGEIWNRKYLNLQDIMIRMLSRTSYIFELTILENINSVGPSTTYTKKGINKTSRSTPLKGRLQNSETISQKKFSMHHLWTDSSLDWTEFGETKAWSSTPTLTSPQRPLLATQNMRKPSTRGCLAYSQNTIIL